MRGGSGQQITTVARSMYRIKQLFGGSLTLRNYDGQVAEALAMMRAH